MDALMLENLTLKSCAMHMNFDIRNIGDYFLRERK